MRGLVGIFIVVSILLSACAVSSKGEIVVISESQFYYCESINAEYRIAYDCAYSSRGPIRFEEFYLSENDSWAIQK